MFRNHPLWRQIHGQLKQAIVEGEFRPGEWIPSEHALAEHFRLNRDTSRSAIPGGAEDGLMCVKLSR